MKIIDFLREECKIKGGGEKIKGGGFKKGGGGGGAFKKGWEFTPFPSLVKTLNIYQTHWLIHPISSAKRVLHTRANLDGSIMLDEDGGQGEIPVNNVILVEITAAGKMIEI